VNIRKLVIKVLEQCVVTQVTLRSLANSKQLHPLYD